MSDIEILSEYCKCPDIDESACESEARVFYLDDGTLCRGPDTVFKCELYFTNKMRIEASTTRREEILQQFQAVAPAIKVRGKISPFLERL